MLPYWLLLAAPAAARPQCAHAPPYPDCPAASTSPYPCQQQYAVSVADRDPYRGRPLISAAAGDSDYAYNFNGPWVPPMPPMSPGGSSSSGGGAGGAGGAGGVGSAGGAGGAADHLIVRVQEDWRSPNATHREWTDTGALALVAADLQAGTVEHISAANVFWPTGAAGAPPPVAAPCVAPHPLCGWGAIDPRLTYRPASREYYLTWDNCTFECAFRTSMLSISADPFGSAADPLGGGGGGGGGGSNASAWELVGPVIPGMQTAGVSLLFRDGDDGLDGCSADGLDGDRRHLAFVSSYDCFTISLAESADGRRWAVTDPTWMQGRPGCWDACGAIAGAQPERLRCAPILCSRLFLKITPTVICFAFPYYV